MTEKFLTKKVGQSIARRRKQANLTQAQLAEQLGIETDSVSRLETGAKSLTLGRLDQLSKLFNCSVASFFLDQSEDSNDLPFTIADMIKPLRPDEKSKLLNLIEGFVDLLIKH
jgi:transcriptional regulator with XRE-family HTH domain